MLDLTVRQFLQRNSILHMTDVGANFSVDLQSTSLSLLNYFHSFSHVFSCSLDYMMNVNVNVEMIEHRGEKTFVLFHKLIKMD